jgi:hypothetical protein
MLTNKPTPILLIDATLLLILLTEIPRSYTVADGRPVALKNTISSSLIPFNSDSR